MLLASSKAASEAVTSKAGRRKGAAHVVSSPGLVLRIAGVLVSALLVSIVIEWLGIAFWWPDEGVLHSQNMVLTETAYLNRDFTDGLFNSSPIAVIERWTERAYYFVFEFTGLENGLQWLGESLGIYHYTKSILFITQLFFIRLGVLIFSLPVYALAAVAGITSGLTLRDIRRWSAGREFGRVYHFAKSFAPRMLIVAWFFYLAIPIAIHPNLIILPFAVLFGINVMVMAASYKKYL